LRAAVQAADPADKLTARERRRALRVAVKARLKQQKVPRPALAVCSRPHPPCQREALHRRQYDGAEAEVALEAQDASEDDGHADDSEAHDASDASSLDQLEAAAGAMLQARR
jgi:hypothetical protein